jgi:energy-coupling factor transporter transmembrane protein EcfT
MLLSPLNWLIHLSSSLEWGVALVMLYRYGQFIGRKDVRRFALFMLPHWIGSWFVLLYHLSGDAIMRLLELSEVINLVGSIALLYATLKILKGDEKRKAKPAKAWMGSLFDGVMLVAGGSTPYSFMMGSSWFDAVLQVSSIVYLTFLVLLLKVRKQDPEVFSGLTVAGFWFVLVFISVTVVCMYIAIHVLGYQSLSHDDLLHGFAESLLSVSNLMIVIGIHKQRKLAEQRLRS